ncbi:hypothetical protein [Natranaerofaba carboxydovora]|uniref:hypothetical protein n=1 Tax=Natranaerofaba carboxydovora TaxID=2742683 RepID=UPI001F12BAE6|nr:hypothetical protein [Natranaerofaba carboxydovora]UMZ73803.1 hypothetical protein ACONDI_01372 [Natranaerofaba carboxydovora]
MKNLQNSDQQICGWLTPHGKFYSCKPCGHRNLAEDIIEKYNINSRGNINADYILEKEGYIRITEDNVYSMETSMYNIDDESFFRKVTQKQLEFLLSYYYDFNKEQREAVDQIVKLTGL